MVVQISRGKTRSTWGFTCPRNSAIGPSPPGGLARRAGSMTARSDEAATREVICSIPYWWDAKTSPPEFAPRDLDARPHPGAPVVPEVWNEREWLEMVAMPVVVLGLAWPMLAESATSLGGKGKLDVAAGIVGDIAEGARAVTSSTRATSPSSTTSAKGGAALNGQIKAFLDAWAKLKDATAKMEMEKPVESCGKLGKDLGMKEDELKAEPKGDGKAA